MRRARALQLVVPLLAWAAGCGGAAPPPAVVSTGDSFEGSLSPPPTSGGDAAAIVAEVNGDRIYASDVADEMRATGKTARDALDTLVDAELLAEEARRRGLTEDPEVVDARRRERVRQFAEHEFATHFATPDAVPDEEVDALWQRPEVHAYFVHGEFRTVIFVRAEAGKLATLEMRERAQKMAQTFYDAALAAHPATADDVKALATSVSEHLPVPLKVSTITTGRHGDTVEDFAAAAFSIGEKGGFAPPVHTNWGWDVLYLQDLVPAREESEAQAAPEIRKQRFEASRRIAFLRWADGFVAQAKVTRHDDLLDAIDVDSLVGLPLTPFTPILQRAVERVPGAVGAIFVASDGEAVDQYGVGESEEMLFLAAHYGIVLQQVQSAMHLFHFGEAEEMILQHRKLDLIVRTVGDGYFVVLAMHAGRHLALALRETCAAASALRAEM